METASGFCVPKLNSQAPLRESTSSLETPRAAWVSPGPNPFFLMQSKYIQALIHRAVNLGKRYIFLGPPEDDEMMIDDVPNMATPFSVTGLHSIAFLALLSAAEQLGYTDGNDVYDRLKNGSEELYIKPLRNHVRVSLLQKLSYKSLF
jgi:hypothetical protein